MGQTDGRTLDRFVTPTAPCADRVDIERDRWQSDCKIKLRVFANRGNNFMRGLSKLNFRRGRVSLAATDRESGFYDF